MKYKDLYADYLNTVDMKYSEIKDLLSKEEITLSNREKFDMEFKKNLLMQAKRIKRGLFWKKTKVISDPISHIAKYMADCFNTVLLVSDDYSFDIIKELFDKIVYDAQSQGVSNSNYKVICTEARNTYTVVLKSSNEVDDLKMGIIDEEKFIVSAIIAITQMAMNSVLGDKTKKFLEEYLFTEFDRIQSGKSAITYVDSTKDLLLSSYIRPEVISTFKPEKVSADTKGEVGSGIDLDFYIGAQKEKDEIIAGAESLKSKE